MIQFETEVVDVIKRAKNVKSFRFTAKDNIDFKPGQFFFVGITIGGIERVKHFSFSNSPTEKGYVEFTKRITGSEFSGALDKLKKGDQTKLKLPFGSFTFLGEYKKIAFLSGGIGITPIRSICKFALDKGLSTDIVLLYGNNTERDIIFRQDLDEIARLNKNFRVIYTLTGWGLDKSDWRERIGHIDSNMIKSEVPDFRERIFFLCGPPQMVENLKGVLKDGLGIGEENIRTENFTGY
ncbi:MAG: FAD-dependent oxidoreductase [Omnitrophica bacterium]|nr:FAD-dependent oxidoreductase [Candidatus Omnitrophota bacterium]